MNVNLSAEAELCVNPVSVNPTLIKEIGETVLIPICLNASNITMRNTRTDVRESNSLNFHN